MRKTQLPEWLHGGAHGSRASHLFFSIHPFGACPSCSGLGFTQAVDPMMVIGDPELSIEQGVPFGPGLSRARGFMATSAIFLRSLSDELDFSLDTPWSQLTERNPGRRVARKQL